MTVRAPGAVRQHCAEDFARGTEQLVVRDDPSHHAPIERLLCGQSAPGEHQVAGAHRPDQPRQHVAVVRVGNSAVQLGYTERRAVTDDGNVGTERDLQPAALTQSVDCDHHGLCRLAQRVERQCVHAQRGSEGQPVVLTAAAHVTAGGEDVPGAGDQQSRQVGVGVDVLDRVLDAEVHRRGHRVACLWTVECADPEWTLSVEPQELRAQPIAFRRTWSLVCCSGLRHQSPVKAAVRDYEILAKMVSANRSMGAR